MANNKDFDQLMHEITSGLTGDNKTDLAYLQEKCEAYKNHELGKEIIRACARMMYDMIPDDKKAELDKLIGNDAAGTNSILEEVRFNIYKKNYDKALSIMEPLVNKFDEAQPFQDDQVSEYRIFDETFEEILYGFLYRPEKDIRHAPVPLTEVYLLYGSLLVELNRISDAQEALKKALHWNPVSFKITSEYMETFKMTGDLDSFFKLTVDAFKIAFRPPHVARCYRNLGYYFVEKELYSEAIACYLLSLQFEKESRQVQSELYYINSKTGGKIKQPSMTEVRQYAEKYGFPLGADDDILGLSFSYGKYFYQEKKTEAAKYFFGITYDLTDDDEIKKIIDSLPNDLQDD